jgi:hypothetical protein
MKKIVLLLVLSVLLVSEVALLTAFLPMSCQRAIDRVLPHTPDQCDITHPDLAGEIDHALRDSPGLAVMFYGVLVVLLSANTWLVRIVWKSLRRVQKAQG